MLCPNFKWNIFKVYEIFRNFFFIISNWKLLKVWYGVSREIRIIDFVLLICMKLYIYCKLNEIFLKLYVHKLMEILYRVKYILPKMFNTKIKKSDSNIIMLLKNLLYYLNEKYGYRKRGIYQRTCKKRKRIDLKSFNFLFISQFYTYLYEI